MTDRFPEATTDHRQFSAFAVLWASATLIHQLAFTFWTEYWPGWVLVFAAFAVLFWPQCLLRFSILVGASLNHFLHKMPFVPNHILFEGMLHIIMLLALAQIFIRRKKQSNNLSDGGMSPDFGTWKTGLFFFLGAIIFKILFLQTPDFSGRVLCGVATTLVVMISCVRFFRVKRKAVAGGADFFGVVAPVIRAAVVIMYLWAALQKWNTDYLNPEVSCAAQLHTEIASYFGGLVPTETWALHIAIWGSFFFEIAIPLFLLWKPTRMLGFVAAVGFHLWLAIHPAAGIYSFSSLILVLLFFFLPNSWCTDILDRWDRITSRLGGGDEKSGKRRAGFLAIYLFFLALLSQGALYLCIERSFSVFQIANRIGFFLFLMFGIPLGWFYLSAAVRLRRRPCRLPGRVTYSPAWIGLLLILGNGLLPWIGLRTQTSFSMYSNLRTEGTGNHLLLERMDFFPYQKRMVRIESSTPDILSPKVKPKGIQQFANPGHKVLPWFEVQRLLSSHKGDVKMVYIEDGKTKTLSRVAGVITGEASAFEAPPWILRKLMWFRRLADTTSPMKCTH